MLSGRPAFRGDTTADVMSAILKEDPPDLPIAERNIPPALARIVARCLEKNPAARFQSTRDLAFALESARTPSGLATDQPRLSPAPGRRRVRLARETAAWFIAVVSLAALAYLARPRSQAPSTAGDASQFVIPWPEGAVNVGVVQWLALSPDGR